MVRSLKPVDCGATSWLVAEEFSLSSHREELKMKKLLTLCVLVILGAGPVASAKMMSQVWYFDTDEIEPTANVRHSHSE